MSNHCVHHAMFHPSCPDCRRKNPQPEDDSRPTPFDFSPPSIPDFSTPDPSPASDPPAPDFGGFDGGTSGGGGADGNF